MIQHPNGVAQQQNQTTTNVTSIVVDRNQQPIDAKQRQNAQHAAGQRPGTVSQDRASRLQQAPSSQSGAQAQNQQERRKVQPPNNLNLQHPSATITKDHNSGGFAVQHSETFTPNSFLQQLKPPISNFTIRGGQGSDDVLETQDRCLTTTAASAPKNLLGDTLQTTLNSVKNQHAAQQRNVIWDSTQNMSRSKGTSAAKDSQPAAMKRRESSAKTTQAPQVTYSQNTQSQAPAPQAVVKPDVHIHANPLASAQKTSSVSHQQRNSSSHQQQVQQAQIMQQQQLKLHNLNTDQQQFFQQNITTETLLPSSSKSQKSVKSTKSSKQKVAQANYTAAIQQHHSVQQQVSGTRQLQKQSPSVERDTTTRIEKLQSAPKTVAKKKPATQQPQQMQVNPAMAAKSATITKQTSSQKKQQSQGSQQRQVQFAVQQPQPPTIYDPSQQLIEYSSGMAEQSPTNLQQQRPTQLSLTVSNNNNSSLSQITNQKNQAPKQCYNLSVASTSQTPKTFKVKSQTATNKQAAAQAGIIFDQSSKLAKQQEPESLKYSSQPQQESFLAIATSGKGTTKPSQQATVPKQQFQQNASRGQASDTKASRQSIQQYQQQAAVSKVCKTTKSTSLKRNTQTVQAKLQPAAVCNQAHHTRDIALQAKSAMTMKNSSKTSTHQGGNQQQKLLQRAPSNSASHEKIKVTVNQQNSSERSPNGISSQDARSTKAANKSFQFIAHSTQLMSCSSGGESTQQVTTKNRSLSGKAGGPQIKVQQRSLGLSSHVQDYAPSNIIQPGTTTNLVQKGLDDSYNEALKQQFVVKPATAQNFKSQNQTFSFEKEERKKIVPKESSKQQHAALINLKNVRQMNSTSQDSKKPALNIVQNSHHQIQQQQSQSPTPARALPQEPQQQFVPQIKTQQQQPQASDDKKLKLNLMKSEQPSSYQIPVHQTTTNAQVKTTAFSNQAAKAGQIKKTSQQPAQQAASQKKAPKLKTTQYQDMVEFANSIQNQPQPQQKVMSQIFQERISLQVLAIQCAGDQQAEQNINMDDPVVLNRILKQIEKLPLKEKDGEQRQRQPMFKQQPAKQIESTRGQQDKSKERQERSKERILESLKSLEMKIDSFSHAHEQHSHIIQQMLASQQIRRSAQSNYSTQQQQALEQVDEPKARGTPQPNSNKISEQQQCVDLIAALPNFERSARLLLVINEEPRLSLISEGINSLQTVTVVDDFLKNSHQASVNIQNSSEQTPSSLNLLPGSSDQDGHNYDTVRQISKCSNYCPGGTLDNDNDLSMSLSDIQPPASDHQARGGLLSRASSIQYPQRLQPQIENVDDAEEDDEALDLNNIEIEEKNSSEQQQALQLSGQQSAPHIPIISKEDPIMAQTTAANQTQVQKGSGVNQQVNDFEVERFSKSQKLRKQEIIVSELKHMGPQILKDDPSGYIQEVQDKLTNISANSAEVNQQIHSLERIRQESGGSALYSKKLTNLFKNSNLKLSKGNIVQQDNSLSRPAGEINFKVPKKSLALIKQNLAPTGQKKGGDNSGEVLQVQRSNSDKDSSLEITNSLMMNQSSELQSRSGLSQIIVPAQRITDQLYSSSTTQQTADAQQVAPSGKSSGSISPFQQKYRIQQRSQERENIFLTKNTQARTESMMGPSGSSNEHVPMSGVPQMALNQQYVLMGQLGCATPKSISSGKILISKQKFNSVLGQQNKSPEVTTPLTIMLPSSSSQQSTQQQPQPIYAQMPAQQQPLTSFSASQLQELMFQKQTQHSQPQYRDNSQPTSSHQPPGVKKEKKLQILVKESSGGGGSGETVDLLQHNSVSKIKMAPKQFSRAEMQRRSEDNHRQ